jgi:hypothetical protein
MWEAVPSRNNRRFERRAPSWSWASVDAKVDVVGAHKRILRCQLDGCPLVEQMEMATVLAYDVRLVIDSNPYGTIEGGSITLQGPLVKANLVSGMMCLTLQIEGLPELSWITGEAAKLLESGHFAAAHTDLSLREGPDLQGHGNDEDGYSVWCLQMRKEIVKSRTLGEVTLMDGLILVPVDLERKIFRRVGV